MTSNRKTCLDSLIQNSKIPVELITKNNLHTHASNLHPGFDYLSATHKSDYLRSYFMYNYGGGYTDIKYCNYDWRPYFIQLENSNKSFIGYKEGSKKDVGYQPAEEHYYKLAGNTHYIFKPHTSFAKRWVEETNKKMDEIYDRLLRYPGNYHPRAIRGGVHGEPNLFKTSNYPLEWNELLGRIFHRIQLDYLEEIVLSMPYPNTVGYR